jgi:FMN phosphatase YigB (HAD superfamily)
MIKQPVLFIDIDGVLFGEYDGYYQLRPGVSSFLVWAGQYFHCEFLTCWSWPRVQNLLETLYIDRRSLKIGYRLWYNFKTDGIDPKREDFYIIDDNLVPEELAQLEAWGLGSRYLRVNKEGSTELQRIQQLLMELVGLGKK